MTTKTNNRPPTSQTQPQMLLVIARWVLVLTGVMLVLWNPGQIDSMRIKIVFLLLLAAGNFYLGTQILRHRRSNELIIYAASLADIVVISLILITEGGYASNSYIFYYPAILAISVVFSTSGLALFVGFTVLAYTMISFITMPFDDISYQVLVTRLLIILAVGVVGNMYRRMEYKRQKEMTTAQEVAEDIFFGQIAIIVARWFFICAATILVLWTAETTGELTIGVLIVGALMSVNFYVHGRYQLEKPANQVLVMITTLIDLVLITFIVMFWKPGGMESHFFIFYYPLFFAFALVFTPRTTIVYTILALGFYAGASLLSNPSIILNLESLELFVTRMITLVAMSGLGTYYYRIQRKRRRTAVQQPVKNTTAPTSLLHIVSQPEN